MRTAIATLAGVAFLLTGAASCLAAEQVDNPQYQAWAKFKPGTTITVLKVTDSGTQKNTAERTSTLISVTADKIVLEEKQVLNVNGQKITQNPFKTNISAKIDPDAGASDGVHGSASVAKPQVKESEEEIEVAGKKVKCKLVESTDASQDAKLVDKKWTSDEVPGHLVKSETSLGGTNVSTTTITVTLTAMTIK